MAKSKLGGVNHVITRDYKKLKGFSTLSKYARPAYVSELAVNIFRQSDGTFGPRRGYQAIASQFGGLGCATFSNPCRCVTEAVTIGTDGSLYVLQGNSFTITYTGASVSSYLSYEIFVDPTTVSDPQNCQFNPYDVIDPVALVNDRIKSRFYIDGSSIPFLDLDFGKGYGVAFPYTVSEFITAINSIPGAVATPSATSDPSTPAAFIDLTELTNIADGQTITIEWASWIKANQTVASPFAGLAAQISNEDFVNASFANFQNILYIGTAYDFPQKYDGHTVYRAGMPIGVSPSALATGTAGNPNGTYHYSITYEQGRRLINDIETGFIVEGVMSEDSNTVTPASVKVDVTVTNLLAGSGWNTSCAIINGAQVGVTTIQVNPDNTLKEGDTAFFIDSSGVEQTREITAATATAITIDGAVVTVNSGDPISSNLKINIWRNESGSSVKRLLTTLPNNSFSATSVYTDDISDAVLHTKEQYNTPIRVHTPPPIAAYLVPYKNQLIFAGVPDQDSIYYSEPNEPEYVPQTSFESNFFNLPSNDDIVTGAGVSGSTLVLFKQRSIYGVSGTLAFSQFEVIPISPGSNIGCAAHATISSIGGLLYFANNNGVYSIAETTIYPTDEKGNPIALSEDIEKRFVNIPINYNRQFRFERAVAINYAADQQYILFIPCEDDPGSGELPKIANTNSRIFCCDYQENNWFEWTNINAAGGFFQLQNYLYFMDRRASPTSTVASNLYNQLRKYRLIDYVDHVTPIRVTWRSSWEDGGQPKVRKKFIRAILLFDDLNNEQQTPNPVMCFKSMVDYVGQVVSTLATVSFANQTAAWSTSPWSFAPWDGYQDSFYVVNLKQGTVTKSMQVELQMNKLNQTFNLQGFQLEISPDFLQTVVR